MHCLCVVLHISLIVPVSFRISQVRAALGEHTFKSYGNRLNTVSHSGKVGSWEIISWLQLLRDLYVKQKGNSLNYNLCPLPLDPLSRNGYIWEAVIKIFEQHGAVLNPY